MKKNYTKKSNEERKSEIEALIKQAQEGIYAFRESDKFKAFLCTMAKFHRYSCNNIMLIHAQCPDASQVASFKKWKEFNRSVIAGQHGIKILCPSTHTLSRNVTNIDAVTGEETVSEELYSAVCGFRVGHVFDISQTQQIPGKPEVDLSLCKELTGNVENYDQIIKALEDISGLPVTIKSFSGTAKGYYEPATGNIVIQAGMPQAQTIKTFVHEIAHSVLHNPSAIAQRGDVPSEVKETEAEATAFVVSHFLGIETSDYSFPYLTTWSGMENDSVIKSMDSIRKASDTIISKLEERL